MEKDIAYNYTLCDSPASDRLVINLDEHPETKDTNTTTTSLQTTQDNQSPVSPPDSSFSMNRLLGDTETSTQADLRHHEQTMEQLMPSIHEAFNLYSNTTLADSLSRIFDLGNSFQQPISQTLPPVAINDTATDLSQKRNPKKEPYKKKKDANGQTEIEKPPYTYVGLIIVAIDSSPEKMLTLADIRSKLESWFPFFNGPYTGWKASVRHSVSSSRCFYKVRQVEDGRSYLWAVNYDNVRPALLVRQNRSTFKDDLFTQYKYNLHEQVGVPAVQLPDQDEPVERKPSGLQLPSKPSFEHSHNIATNSDLMSGRNDDVLSQNGDSDNKQFVSLKRKADTLGDDERQDNLKRKKTLAVNPTPNTESYCQTIDSTANTTNETITKSTDLTSHHKTNTNTPANYLDQCINGTYPTLLNHNPQQWPHAQDTFVHYPTATPNYNYFNNYQNYDYNSYQQYQHSGYINQHQHALSTYQMWPYNNIYTQGQGHYNYHGYWNQMVDSTSIPVNLSKQSDSLQ